MLAKIIWAVLFCSYLLFDTSLILKGQNTYIIDMGQNPTNPFKTGNNAILAVVKLYIDIVCIFMALLALCGEQDG